MPTRLTCGNSSRRSTVPPSPTLPAVTPVRRSCFPRCLRSDRLFNHHNPSAFPVHEDHVSAIMTLDYAPTGKEFVTGSYDRYHAVLCVRVCTYVCVYVTVCLCRVRTTPGRPGRFGFSMRRRATAEKSTTPSECSGYFPCITPQVRASAIIPLMTTACRPPVLDFFFFNHRQTTSTC